MSSQDFEVLMLTVIVQLKFYLGIREQRSRKQENNLVRIAQGIPHPAGRLHGLGDYAF